MVVCYENADLSRGKSDPKSAFTFITQTRANHIAADAIASIFFGDGFHEAFNRGFDATVHRFFRFPWRLASELIETIAPDCWEIINPSAVCVQLSTPM